MWEVAWLLEMKDVLTALNYTRFEEICVLVSPGDQISESPAPRKVWIVLPIAFRQRSALCPFNCSILTGALAKHWSCLC
jgi:hypothetical protein